MAFKVSSKIVKASKRLCVIMIERHKGASAIANSLGYNRQYIHKWIRDGYVPLVQVHDFSQLIKCSRWAVSYHKLLEIFGEEAPLFADVVNEAPIFDADKEEILKILNGK